MRKSLLVLTLVASTMLLAGCGGDTTEHSPQEDTPTRLLTITFTGGLCNNNQTCEFEYGIYNDGHFDEHTPLTTQEITELQNLLAKADFSALLKSETPFCASYYDGQDLGIQLPDMEEPILPCEYDNSFDNELITYIVRIVDTHPLVMVSN